MNQISLKEMIIGKEGRKERGELLYSAFTACHKLPFLKYFGQAILDSKSALTAKRECVSQSEH